MATEADLIAAVIAGDAARIRAILAGDPALVAARNEAGVSALLLSRYRFDRAATEALLAADPQLDVFEAAAVGDTDRLREGLLVDPAAATAYSPDGFTPLHLAAFFGKPEAAKLLLEHGADAGAYTRNPLANKPLHAAAAGRHIEVCRILLAAGADVNATQHGGFTPLHQSAHHGDIGMSELFLSALADTSARTDAGQTPAEFAAAAGHADLAERIREVGAGG